MSVRIRNLGQVFLVAFWGNTALGVWHKETSTDRRSFEANRGLTHQEGASSINHKKEGLSYVANNEKRSLTPRGIEEEIDK